MDTKEIIKIAESGDSEAQSALGYLYLAGDGKENQKMLGYYAYVMRDFEMDLDDPLKRNYEEAFKWFGLAAEDNEPLACRSLGKFYQFGCVVDKDFRKAIELFRRADELGEFSLAELYFEIIIKEDLYDEYKDSLAEESDGVIMELAKNISRGELNINAIDLFFTRKAGDSYDYGEYREDEETAAEILEIAANRGCVDAIYALGCTLRSDDCYEPEKAVEWYEKGWKLQDDRCGYMLAQCLEEGEGTAKNIERATSIYETLSKSGNLKAEAKKALKNCKKNK